MVKRSREGPATPSGRTSGWTALHRLRTITWKPSGVEVLAHASGKAVAAARQSGRIELWDPVSWTRTAVIHSSSTAAVSALAWVLDPESDTWGLVSGGLSGQLECWSPQTLACTSSTDSFGGAVWSMCAQPGGNLLAAGMDDGCVRFFSWTSAGGLQYNRSLQQVAGRVLSLAWHPSGTTLVGGTSKGSIHVWEAATATELLCIELEDGESDTCVWAVEVLQDGTVVSGDSSGAVIFWDGRHGTRICQFRHPADVLSLAATPTGSQVFAAGRAPHVRMYHQIRQREGHKEPRWEAVDGQSHHTHDVPCLLLVHGQQGPPQLVSGSLDSRIYAVPAARFLKERPRLVCPLPEAPQIAITHAQGRAQPRTRVLACTSNTLDLWELPLLSPEVQAPHQEGLQVGAPGKLSKLCSIRCAGDRAVQAACLNCAGSAVAWAEGGSVRMLQITSGDTGVQLGKPAVLAVPPTLALSFVPQSSTMLMLHPGRLNVAEERPDGSLEMVEGVDLSALAEGLKRPSCQGPAATMVAAGPGGSRAAVAGPACVALLTLSPAAVQAELQLPKGAGAVTAIAFSPDAAHLAVAATGSLLLYDVQTCSLSEWSRQHGAAMAARLKGPEQVHTISFQPSEKGLRAVLAAGGALLHVDFEAPAAREDAGTQPGRRGRKLAHHAAGQAQAPGINGRLLPLQTLCLGCSHTSSSSLLLVEKAWTDILQTLPPPVYRARYGS